MEKDGSIRSISRGLTILKLINSNTMLTMADIARISAIPYPTACRIVETLIDEGMVQREAPRKVYRPTPLVKLLSSGYRRADQLADAAQRPIAELTRRILWPVSVCTRVGGDMMVQASSNRLSPKAVDYCSPGQITPILESSSGLVFLAFCEEDERNAVLRLHDSLSTYSVSGQGFLKALSDIRERGFSFAERFKQGVSSSVLSSLSAPIMRDGYCEASATVTFFASALTMNDATGLLLEDLFQTAKLIERELHATR
ncbi:helix-turn-helix domain-containing protein [Beijerinckia sp. L45]|uniref:helix-turn-helix domain-containing protein n=1 Tax=Beijerinckia sp. L45 TaxID=1641855 RepID=UPI00131B7109|nr:helix-turn-helix domain-containing protein [Beijerinckia sp. L45]